MAVADLMPRLTRHALKRLIQRGIALNSVVTALNQAVPADEGGVRIYRHEGLTVICGRDGSVITTYRDSSRRTGWWATGNPIQPAAGEARSSA